LFRIFFQNKTSRDMLHAHSPYLYLISDRENQISMFVSPIPCRVLAFVERNSGL
jgi:hypothetical protein